MSNSETYPIHRCIFKNDAIKLSELLEDEENRKRINEKDNHGNTPIHLSLMLNRHNCTAILLKHNCDIFSRNTFGYNPLDEASMNGDIDIIEKISYKRWEEYVNALVKPGGFLDEWNKTTPNLFLKYRVKIKTTIPFLQKFGAKDLENVYKKGKNIRLDTTIGGIDVRGFPKIIRKNMSIYYLYEESEGINKIYLVDHTNKHYQELFPVIPKWFLTNLINSKLGSNTIYKYTFDMSKYEFKAMKTLLKKNTRTFSFENGKSYKCEHYKGKNVNIIIKKRSDQGLIGTCESVIKYETKKEKDSDDKSKSKMSLFKKRSKTSSVTSKPANDTEDESDSDSDSSDDSDLEENKGKATNLDDNNIGSSTLFEDPLIDKKANRKGTVTYTVNKDGKTETYEKTTSMEDTIDWEQAYHDKYANDSDTLYALFNGKKEKTKLKILSHSEIEKLNLKNLSEEEYFNSSSTDKLHLGKIMNVNEEKRLHNNVKFWMTKKDNDFPLNALDIKPILQYLFTIIFDQVNTKENICEYDKQAFEYFSNDMPETLYKENIFPIRISIPIYSAVAYQVTFLNASKEKDCVNDDLFKIPSDYIETDVFFEHRK